MATTSKIATLIPALLLATAMVVFALHSYPMMRPGLDVWVHLGLIDSPQQVDPSILPASRILWHHFWHAVMEGLEVHELFDRALLIHRVQTLLTMVLITIGAYFGLSTLIQRRDGFQSSELWLAAMFSAVIWLLLNGTQSTARTGGADSTFIQSWIIWYSINYQISLPLYFASVGLFLYALDHANERSRRVLAFALSFVCITLATLVHAAETAYFLICLVFIAIIYQRRHQRWKIFLGFSMLCGIVFWAASSYSYITPIFLKLKSIGDFQAAASTVAAYGAELTQNGLSRPDTAWHAMHSACLFSLGLAAFFRWRRTLSHAGVKNVNWHPWIFVLLTASMPLALLQPIAAGSLALATHLHIAWRFSFASFLFIAPSALGLIITSYIPPKKSLLRQIILSSCIILVTLLTLIYSQTKESSKPSVNYGKSLTNSLSKEKSFFGITDMERRHLQRLIEMRSKFPPESLLCTDIHTAYYLFFVEHFHAVNMPTPLHYLPGYRSPDPSCRFEFSPESLGPR